MSVKLVDKIVQSKVPPLSDFKPGLRPTGFNILVGLPPAEKMIGNIIVPDNVSDRERLGEVRGRIVAMSSACFDFADFGDDKMPKVGDAIIFSKFAGVVTKGDDDMEYRVILDKDVVAVIDEGGSDA